jgi:hypothetical protein
MIGALPPFRDEAFQVELAGFRKQRRVYLAFFDGATNMPSGVERAGGRFCAGPTDPQERTSSSRFSHMPDAFPRTASDELTASAPVVLGPFLGTRITGHYRNKWHIPGLALVRLLSLDE